MVWPWNIIASEVEFGFWTVEDRLDKLHSATETNLRAIRTLRHILEEHIHYSRNSFEKIKLLVDHAPFLILGVLLLLRTLAVWLFPTLHHLAKHWTTPRPEPQQQVPDPRSYNYLPRSPRPKATYTVEPVLLVPVNFTKGLYDNCKVTIPAKINGKELIAEVDVSRTSKIHSSLLPPRSG
ncbi:hypothetical protein P171DRAFT_506047 [Karstenula rhodostoma CBS 690.94]|uniref:Uncharacterized protein n=1 Tax=Karstenula rhodostoma CBS 690.94 TaxID=1392251 RepID=A0A9P4U5G6_9PLEO|nr:hypothetical protein P171DRAFT_506047 [Karstenula rhodostoma CBS 690.94]